MGTALRRDKQCLVGAGAWHCLKDYLEALAPRLRGWGNPKEDQMEGRGNAGRQIQYRREIKRTKKFMKKLKKRDPETHKKLKEKIDRWKKWDEGWSGIF
jgi:hypothetical protein